MEEPRIYRIEDLEAKRLIFKVSIPYKFIVSNENWTMYVISMLTKMIQKVIKEHNVVSPTNP